MPPKSMTGFGSSELICGTTHYRCEVKSVNSRFHDIDVRMPRNLGWAETEIIGLTKSFVRRGKVEISIRYQTEDNENNLPTINLKALNHYKKLYEEIAQPVITNLAPLTFAELLKLEGIVETRVPESADILATKHKDSLLKVTTAALKALVHHREKEGLHLCEALRDQLNIIDQHTKQIDAQSASIRMHLAGRVQERMRQLLSDPALSSMISEPSDERLAAEITIMLDKIDIEEEITRLLAHVSDFRESLASDKENGMGRKLDFLAQELHREINTISSKLQHLTVRKSTIEIKQAVERIRQQVQNIE